MVAYLYATDSSRMRAKANVQFFFLTQSAAVLGSHFIAGSINSVTLLRSLPFVPLVLIGTKCGALLSRKIHVSLFRTITDILLMALGGYLLVNHLASSFF